MKMFKKALVAGLGLVSMAAIASCNNKTYDVEGAAKRVVVEQNKSKSVTSDFEVAKKVSYKDSDYTVTWTSNNEYATVKNIEGNDSKYLIDIEYVKNQNSDQEVKLTAEIKDPKGATVTKEFNFTVPKFVVEFALMVEAPEAVTPLIEPLPWFINVPPASVTAGVVPSAFIVKPVPCVVKVPDPTFTVPVFIFAFVF